MLRGCNVRIHIGFGPKEPDRCGIVRIAGKEQAVGTIDQSNCVRRVTRCGDDFQFAAAQIDGETVVYKPRNLPRLRRISLRVESCRQAAANLIRSEEHTSELQSPYV